MPEEVLTWLVQNSREVTVTAVLILVVAALVKGLLMVVNEELVGGKRFQAQSEETKICKTALEASNTLAVEMRVAAAEHRVHREYLSREHDLTRTALADCRSELQAERAPSPRRRSTRGK